jgi:photosystem II stability/assembly factor-like uncharacterized protein
MIDLHPRSTSMGISPILGRWLAASFAATCLVAALPSPRAAGLATPVEKPKYKAIWEPVNYGEDLELTGVHFVDGQTGYVTGAAGTILFTKDGGTTWTAQLGGDPKASDRPIRDLRFIDATHGWAVQSTGGGDHRLLHTRDGQSWEDAGTVAQHRGDYTFVSDTDGFCTSHDQILATKDGGRTWRPAYACRVKTEINGLTREVSCELATITFASPKVGYAVSTRLDTAGFALAKTEDGGATWSATVVLPGEDGKESALTFTDASTGFLRTLSGKLFKTVDGGKTWTGIPAHAPDGKPRIEFADPEVGWMVHYNAMTYTIDAGKRWITRQIRFPAPITDFSLPSRDHGYAVGEHGMVYRYRIVPVAYTSKGMLDAPGMPAR